MLSNFLTNVIYECSVVINSVKWQPPEKVLANLGRIYYT